MLEYRKDAAHPPLINLGLPISDRFNDHEKKMVEDIRQMAVELHMLRSIDYKCNNHVKL